MAGLDDLLQPQSNELGDTGYTFVDADTLRDADGNRFRIQGVDAPEVAHFTGDRLETGQVGGAMSTEQVIKLANEMGFTNIKKLGELDDTGTREVIDLTDSSGRSFRRALAREGILPISYDHDNAGLFQSQEYGAFLRTQAGREESTWDQARAMIEQSVQDDQRFENQFKQKQLIAGDARLGDDFSPVAAAFEYSDRSTATGKSNNPLSDAWDTGLIGVQEAAFGIIDLLGEKTDYDPLKHIGEAGINRARTRIVDRGHFITDYKDVDGFWDAIEYVGTNTAISIPYMGISIAGAALGPIGLAAPAAIYTGQTWNEMEGEKSASVAIASGVLQATFDRLGIAGIFRAGKPPKQLVADGVKALMDKGHSRQAATDLVMNASRKELAQYAGDAATVAARQLSAKQLFKDLAARTAVGAGTEGVTEATQEATAYLGATLGSDKVFNWEELNERALSAAIAGSTLGGAFSLPSTAVNAGAWADVAYRTAPAEAKRQSDAGRWANEEVAAEGRVKSVRELNEETSSYLADNKDTIVPLDERVQAERDRRKDRTAEEKITETALATPGLWRGTIRHIIPQHIKDQSRAARKLADIFGGQLQKTFSGAAFENEKFHRVAQYKNMVSQPEQVFSVLNGGKIPTEKRKREIGDEIYTILQTAVDRDGNFDPALVPEGPYRQTVISLQQELQRLSDKMYADQLKHNPDLGKLKNYLGRYKSFDKRAIAKNKEAFIQALLDKTQYAGSRAEATELADTIINNQEVNDFGEAFSAIKGEFKPPAHQQRTLNLAEDPEFAQFMERDIFANVSQAVRSAARYTTQQDFVGKNGEKVAALLDEMQAEGVDPQTVNKIAAGMQDYLDAESGNYKRAKSKVGKDLEKLQKNFMFVTMVAGLPLATVSSFVELALTMRGLTADQIFGKKGKGGLKAIGEEFADTAWKGMGTIASYRPGGKYGNINQETAGKHELRRLGFYEWDVGAATVTGATEINPLRQKISQKYFEITGLSGWTNYTRAVRGSIAADYIIDKVQMVMETDPENPTNESQEATEALRNLGINVEDMVQLEIAQMRGQVTPEMEAQFDENIREGMFNFINDAVALPQAANRPLIYQDPRFALFTQFQGFIATFTANHIPKLWGEYVRRGTPAMKYNAFAIMTTMIALGFASQYLKDLIKYGQKSPYLEDPEYFQRGIRASGLLGSGERLLDQFAPIYETRSRNPIDWVYNQTTGEAPALGNIARAGKGVGKLLEGDIEGGIYQGLKTAPLIAPLTGVNKGIAGFLTSGEWNFNGDK